MKNEKLEVVRGTGNVFRDLGTKTPMRSSSRLFWPLKLLRRSTEMA